MSTMVTGVDCGAKIAGLALAHRDVHRAKERALPKVPERGLWKQLQIRLAPWAARRADEFRAGSVTLSARFIMPHHTFALR